MNRWLALTGFVVLLVAQAAPVPPAAAAVEPAAGPDTGQDTSSAGKASSVDRLGDSLPSGASVRLGTPRWRHRSRVYFVAFSPDGKFVASSCFGGFTRLWEASSGRELHTFADAGRWTASALAFSPDSSRLALVQEGGAIRLYEVPSGKLLRDWNHPSEQGGRMFGIAYLPDGERLATSGGESLRVWNVADGTELQHLNAPEGELFTEAIAFSPARGELAVATDAGRVQLADPATAAATTLIEKAHIRRIGGLCFTADGQTLITGGSGEPRSIGLPTKDGMRVGSTSAEIRFWDVATGQQTRELRANSFDSGTGPIALTPDGKTLVSAHHEQIRIWDVASGNLTWEIESHYNSSGMAPTSLALSSDGAFIAGGNAHAVQLWTLDGQPHVAWLDGHVRDITTVHRTPGGDTILTAERNGDDLRVWNAATGELVRRIELSAEGSSGLETVAISPDARTIVAGGGHRISGAGAAIEFRGELRFWNVADAAEQEMKFSDVVGSIVWSPDGKLIAGVTRNLFSPQGRPRGAAEKILLVDAARRELLTELRGHEGEIVGAAFVERGQALLSVGADGSVRRWKIASGEELGTFQIPGERQRPLADAVFSPDGALVATCELFGDTIAVWDLARRQERVRIRAPGTLGNRLAISPDGRWLASACQSIIRSHDQHDESIYVWDLRNGQRIGSFAAADGAVTTLAFSPHGGRLLSGTSRGTVLIWEVDEVVAEEGATER